MGRKKFGPDAWKLWRSMFKDGDEVVAITDDDRVVAGKIKAKPMTCTIKRIGFKAVEIDWDDIRFIAHDGFPVKKLLGADGSATIEALNTRDKRKAIRKMLTYNFCKGCGKFKLPEEFPPYDKERVRRYCGVCRDLVLGNITPRETPLGHTNSMVFGDPFIIEGVSARLLNPGNVYLGRGEGYKGWAFEEVLVLRSKDGAAGLLYDLHTIYHFEAA